MLQYIMIFAIKYTNIEIFNVKNIVLQIFTLYSLAYYLGFVKLLIKQYMYKFNC